MIKLTEFIKLARSVDRVEWRLQDGPVAIRADGLALYVPISAEDFTDTNTVVTQSADGVYTIEGPQARSVCCTLYDIVKPSRTPESLLAQFNRIRDDVRVQLASLGNVELAGGVITKVPRQGGLMEIVTVVRFFGDTCYTAQGAEIPIHDLTTPRLCLLLSALLAAKSEGS